jgi:predicted dehydrogenase
MEKVKIGFVGVGGMGQCAHLKNYATLPDCEVVAIADIRPKLAEAVARKYGIPRVYPDHLAMLAAEKPDGIVASQPYCRHSVLLRDLVKAGVPIFTEKPLSCSVEAGEAILTTLASSSATHYLGYHKRSDPATMYARKEIDRLRETGELGAMKYVRLLMPAGDWVASGFTDLIGSDDPMPPLETDPLPADMDEATQREYDTFVNYYIHQVNLMRHLLGESYSVSYADPASVLMVVHGKSGVPGTIEMSPYCTTVDWQEQALVAFERGFVKLDLPAPLANNRPGRVTIFRDPGNGETPETIEPQMPWIHAMRQQALNFLKAIRGETTPLTQSAEALEDLMVARDYIRMMKQ